MKQIMVDLNLCQKTCSSNLHPTLRVFLLGFSGLEDCIIFELHFSVSPLLMSILRNGTDQIITIGTDSVVLDQTICLGPITLCLGYN